MNDKKLGEMTQEELLEELKKVRRGQRETALARERREKAEQHARNAEAFVNFFAEHPTGSTYAIGRPDDWDPASDENGLYRGALGNGPGSNHTLNI